MTDGIKPQVTWMKPAAWALIVLVWIATPFMGDRLAPWIHWAYALLTIAALVFGLYVARQYRGIALAIMSILTGFAWLIVLVVGLALYGI